MTIDKRPIGTLPEPTDDEDLMNMYFRLMFPSSECPLIYHRWGLISIVGAMLGRQCFLPLGIDNIYPNMYVCLIGSAGSRKSSAVKACRKTLEGTEYSSFARERTSKEKFLKDLADGFGKTKKESIDDLLAMDLHLLEDPDNRPSSTGPSEVYISAGELEDFLGQNDTSFISLLTNLWDNLDGYSHGKMTSEDIGISEPTINLMGGATSTTFNSVFPPEVIGQGMLSRLLIVYGGGPRTKITFPPRLDETKKAEIVDYLRTIKETVKGELKITPEVEQIWDDIYQTEYSLGDYRFDNYMNRRHVHYMKLCIIIAAMDLSTTIDKSHALKANSILAYTESLMPKALGEFGMAKNADSVNTVLSFVTEHYIKTGRGADLHKDIWPAVSNNFESMSKDFTAAILKLKTSNKIVVKDRLLVPTAVNSKTSIPHVDFSGLWEYLDSKKEL